MINPQTDLNYTDANNPPSPQQLKYLSFGDIEHIVRHGSTLQVNACLDWAYGGVSAEMYYTWCDIAGQSYRYDDDWTAKHPSMSQCTKAKHVAKRDS